MSKINQIWAREILDSRGEPTVEAICKLDTGHFTVASVPAGALHGAQEAKELRDEDPERMHGKGVTRAVGNVNEVLGPAVVGMEAVNQDGIDARLIQLDGTENKSKYGANAILAVSTVVAKAGSIVSGKSLYLWISQLAQAVGIKSEIHVPTPIFNMINGGLHGAGNLDFQEFHVIPASNKTYSEGLQAGVEIYYTVGEHLERRGAIHSVGDEGGYAPNLFTNADGLEMLVESIKESKYDLGRDVFLGLDVAAGAFYKNGEYHIRDKSSPLGDKAMIEYYKSINDQYHLALLEDPLYEESWDGWAKLNKAMGAQLILVGDDLLVTHPKRVEKAIKEAACNAILVKPNQIGTITETLKVVKQTRDVGWKIIVSHRSGETNDAFIADFAVGVGADYTKFGGPARGERVEKYNRLSAIEAEMSHLTTKK